MKNQDMDSRYPAGAWIRQTLERVRAGDIPADGSSLLEEGRKMRQAADSRELWLRLPFSMMCETQYGNKEGYQEIIREFDRVKARDYDRMAREACAGKADGEREMAWFLAACVDTLEFTSEEIYEHYRYLVDLVRKTAGILAEGRWKDVGVEGMEPETARIYGDSLLKGCRLGALLREKYEGFGKALLAYGDGF